MRCVVFVVAGLMWLTPTGPDVSAATAEAPRLLAAGEWSEPVADADSYAVRGRLVLCERAVEVGGKAHFPRQQRREVVVYIELQEVSGFVGRPLRLFCDFARTDFRPENKSGLQCDLLDKDQRPVAPTRAPFGGGIPASQWVTLPPDATIRLRSSPFGIHRASALAVAPHAGRLWVIGQTDPNDYFLTGTFTIDPGGGEAPDVPKSPPADPAADAHIWRGTIVLPLVRINSHDRPQPQPPTTAASQPAAGAGP